MTINNASRFSWLSFLWRDIPIRLQRLVILTGIWLIPLAGAVWTLHRAPDWVEPRTVHIQLNPSQTSIVLGHDRPHSEDDRTPHWGDLWSPHADPQHIRLLRATDGGWWLQNVSAAKQVLWKPQDAKTYRRVREWNSTPGGQFTIGPHAFTVTAVTADSIAFQALSSADTWRYNGQNLFLNGQTLPACDPPSFLGALRKLIKKNQPLSFGGGVQCASRLGLLGVAPDQAALVARTGGFVLRLGAAAVDGAAVRVGNPSESLASLHDQWIPLHVGDQLIIGYTSYQVEEAGSALALAITARGQRWPADQPTPASQPGVQVLTVPLGWGQRLPFMPLFTMSLITLGVLALVMIWFHGRYLLGPSTSVRLRLALYLGLACGSLTLFPWGDPPVFHLSAYPLAWLAAVTWLWPGSRTIWSALLVGCWFWVLGWGLVAQLQLGLGAEESVWLRYGAVMAATSSAVGWALGGLVLFLRHFQPSWWQPSERVILWKIIAPLTLLTLMGLGLQMLSGDEGGLGLLQPLEPTKLMLVVTVALALAYRKNIQGWDTTLSKPYLWFRYLGPGLTLAMIVGFALLFLNDFSPIILLSVSAFVLAWAYLRIHPGRRWRWGGQLALAGLAALLVTGVQQLHRHPGWFPSDLQSERIQVWATPDLYPHAGYQLRQGLAAIRDGGWLGVNAGLFSGNSEPGRNGRVMGVPALQDDFAPTFFLNRYGGLMGLLLLAAQLLLVLTLLGIGVRALRLTAFNDYRAQLAGWFAYFALAGGAGLLAAHGLVSWGTNLGFLPVMGQPMPLLSSAGSHLVFFIAPIMALALVLEAEHPNA